MDAAAARSPSPVSPEMTPETEETGAEDEQIPGGLSREEFEELKPLIAAHHSYGPTPGRRQCSSLLAQRVAAPPSTVWSLLRRFDKPQLHKHFIRSCSLKPADAAGFGVGSLREVSVISGLPATTSTERLDVLDEDRRVFGFSIIGGEHRLRNYKSVTTASEAAGGDGTVVIESYIVDVPDGNSEEDTRLFADTVVRLNLQKLAAVAERLATQS